MSENVTEPIKPQDLLYYRLDSFFGDAPRQHIPALAMNLLAEVVSEPERWPMLRKALDGIKEELVEAGCWNDMLVEIDNGVEAYLRLANAPTEAQP